MVIVIIVHSVLACQMYCIKCCHFSGYSTVQCSYTPPHCYCTGAYVAHCMVTALYCKYVTHLIAQSMVAALQCHYSDTHTVQYSYSGTVLTIDCALYGHV